MARTVSVTWHRAPIRSRKWCRPATSRRAAGRTGAAGNTYYTVTATAGESYSGYNFDDFQIPTCAPTNVSYTVTNSSGKVCYTGSTLAGNTQQGDTVTVNFTVRRDDRHSSLW